MVDELVLASNNGHKRREFARLFPHTRIILPREAGLELDFPEDGGSFFENAMGKALALYSRARRPVMADDSGLCVDALDGAPGLYSNRFGAPQGGAPLDAPRRNALLLERMKGVRSRAAHFVCCLVLVLGRDRFIAAQETVEGEIGEAPRGANGFGYDPVFVLPGRGQTLAEIADAEKDEVSHRGRAARRVLAALASGA